MKKTFLTKYLIGSGGSILLLWLLGYWFFLCSITWQQPRDTTARTEAIIVVTGGAYRINTALDLLKEKQADQLLVSGVDPRVSLHDLLSLWHGDPADIECCVTLGHNANDTEGNAQEAKAWMENNGFRSLRLVTSDYHMPRTLLTFRHKLPEAAIIPHPVQRKDKFGNTVAVSFGEYNKTILTLLWYIFTNGEEEA